MKKITVFCMLALVVVLGSCKKIKEKINKLVEFEMSYRTSFTLPSAGVIPNTPVDFTTTDIETNSESQFASQQTVAEKVSEVKLTKVTLIAETGNFDYLKSISIFIQAPNQQEIRVASRSDIPKGLTVLELDLDDENLKPYISGKTFRLRVNAMADEPIAKDQKIQLDETMRVKASLL